MAPGIDRRLGSSQIERELQMAGTEPNVTGLDYVAALTLHLRPSADSLSGTLRPAALADEMRFDLVATSSCPKLSRT
jgi:hypothetical protein